MCEYVPREVGPLELELRGRSELPIVRTEPRSSVRAVHALLSHFSSLQFRFLNIFGALSFLLCVTAGSH